MIDAACVEAGPNLVWCDFTSAWADIQRRTAGGPAQGCGCPGTSGRLCRYSCRTSAGPLQDAQGSCPEGVPRHCPLIMNHAGRRAAGQGSIHISNVTRPSQHPSSSSSSTTSKPSLAGTSIYLRKDASRPWHTVSHPLRPQKQTSRRSGSSRTYDITTHNVSSLPSGLPR